MFSVRGDGQLTIAGGASIAGGLVLSFSDPLSIRPRELDRDFSLIKG